MYMDVKLHVCMGAHIYLFAFTSERLLSTKAHVERLHLFG